MLPQRRFLNVIDAYLDYSKNREASDKIKKWSFISALAGLLERKVWIEACDFNIYPNMYIVIVGKSGLIHKSTTINQAVSFLREFDDVFITADKFTQAALIESLKMSEKEVVIGREYRKQAAMFIHGSEFSETMEEVYGSVIGLLTTLYDNHKSWKYHLKGEGLIHINEPCINILGASTPEWLKKIIPEREMAGGFSSRFIFVVENKAPEKLIPWPKADEAQKQLRTDILHDLALIHQINGPYDVTPQAIEWFNDWYEYHKREVTEKNNDNRFSGYFGRKDDNIKKLAMIHSAARQDERIIETVDIEWAEKQLTGLEKEMFAIFKTNEDQDFGQLIIKVNAYLKAKRLVDERELRVFFTRITKDPVEIDMAIDALERLGNLKKFAQLDTSKIWIRYTEDSNEINQKSD